MVGDAMRLLYWKIARRWSGGRLCWFNRAIPGRRQEFSSGRLVAIGVHVRPRRERARAALASLTERAREIALAIGEGRTNAEIAGTHYYLSIATVKAHVTPDPDQAGRLQPRPGRHRRPRRRVGLTAAAHNVGRHAGVRIRA